MRWNITKESCRPLQKEQTKWDIEKQESVLVNPQIKELKCLCVLKNESEPIILTYVLSKDKWFCDCEFPNYFIDYDDVEKWIPLSEVNNHLDGKPEPMWCWEFGQTLAETAIPALDVWINKGASYDPSMTYEEWKEVLKKIKYAFEVSLYDLNDSVLDVPDIKERQRITEEHAKIRKEGFNLMADHWLGMWD